MSVHLRILCLNIFEVFLSTYVTALVTVYSAIFFLSFITYGVPLGAIAAYLLNSRNNETTMVKSRNNDGEKLVEIIRLIIVIIQPLTIVHSLF